MNVVKEESIVSELSWDGGLICVFYGRAYGRAMVEVWLSYGW
jgi:hypothetical protein